MKKSFLYSILLLLLICMPLVIAQEGRVKLLALVESKDNRSGGVVDLKLQVEQGSGRVFLETVPLTKITTQISMRFAQAMACKELGIDCTNRDFFYTIRGFPGVVGGPSAGAAATILAMSTLQNVELDSGVAITGTINSGGIIGPVGGVKEKIEAAADSGLHTILIPQGTASYTSDDNVTIDLVEHGKAHGANVVEVSSIRDALPFFGEFVLPQSSGDFVVDDEFSDRMKTVAHELCGRRDMLAEQVENSTGLLGNLTRFATQSLGEENYYATASYCFRSSIILSRAYYESLNMTQETLLAKRDDTLSDLARTRQSVDARSLDTLTDLQVWMSVDERLIEAKTVLDEVESSADLAYAIERLESAKSWSRFFGGDDKAFDVGSDRLEKACTDKLSEAEERYSYLLEFVNTPLTNTRQSINQAYDSLNDGEYVRCLYAASKVKAEIDSLLGFVPDEDAQELFDAKMDAVYRELRHSQEQGVFPIISYNYAKYAESLAIEDVRSALLFAEYALEFSTLDVYFERSSSTISHQDLFRIGPLEGFLIGIGVGILFTLIYLSFAVGYVRKNMHSKKKSSKSKKTRQTPKRSRGKKR